MTALPAMLQSVRDRYVARPIQVRGQVWTLRDTRPGTQEAPLVMLPGALGTGDVFYKMLAALGHQHRLVALSYPTLESAQALADSLIELFEAMAWQQVDLLGTSLGGYIAQAAVVARSERVRRLVLSSTFFDAELQKKRWPPAEQFSSLDVQAVAAAAREQLRGGPEPTSEHAELKQVMLALVGSEQTGPAIRAMRLAVLTATPLPPVPLDQSCITLIDDDGDPVIAEPTRLQMRRRYSGSLHIRIAGGGHFPANLCPQAYEAALRRILQA